MPATHRAVPCPQSDSIDTGLYQEALAELAQALPKMDVQVSTESGGLFDVAAQLQTLATLKPAWVSLSIREVARDMTLVDRVYGTCADNGTIVQHILFDEADAQLLADWQANGLVRPDQDTAILVLGRYTKDMNSDPDALAPFVAALPALRRWMLCAFGPQEHACLRAAVKLGGDVRIGFENSHVDHAGVPHRDNAESIAKFRDSLS